MPKTYDFSGWATKNDLLCSDGRVIKRDAFKDCDGTTVPLVWNHDHKSADNVLGHALLENREDGVYAYCSFNDTEAGQIAKKLVDHQDIKSLSIWANKLKHDGANVIHGAIREVSLVLAGANPGAYIDSVAIAHSVDPISEDEVVIYSDEISLEHGEEVEQPSNEEVPKEDDQSENKEEENSDRQNYGAEKELEHSEGEKEMENNPEKKEKTVQDVIDSMTDEQKNVMYALVGMAAEEKEEVKHSDENNEEDTIVHNLFENNQEKETLAHSEEEVIAAFEDAKTFGSMKKSFLSHGIDNIDYLFPDAKNLTNTPGFINTNPIDWVTVVMNGVHHTPFSRIKMMFADITVDQARAKGYIKGNLKVDEVFGLLKRTVTPTTIYKKQTLDRDDVVDITDFDVVAWMKSEMRMKLDEEIARAILFGDGRTAGIDPDKISESNIIPIIKDTTNNLYAMEKVITPASGESLGHALINGIVKAMDSYEGSGNTIAFLAQGSVSDMLLLEDGINHRLYKTVNELADAMGVSRIVKVPASIIPTGYYGLVVDLKDYNVGADKGGAVNMFDDFDIDYNQQKYLIETRCSGALIKPHSAIVLKAADAV